MSSAAPSLDQELPADSLAGEHIGAYRLVREIGRSGMGVVYEAVHEQLGQRAAVKLLFPHLGREPAYRRRFLDEGRAASVVTHPGLVRIFDCGEHRGLLYLLMEYLEGESLWQRLTRLAAAGARLAPAEALRIARQAAAALRVVHERAIVHRDIKPENLFLARDSDIAEGERVKVLDFGVAKFLEGRGRRTTPGRVLGTMTYMAPEQGGEGAVSDRADVYALGVVLYEMLAGRPPFDGSAEEVMHLHAFTEPAPLVPLVPGLQKEGAALVHRMLAKLPQLRPSMAVVVERIRAIEAAPTAARGPVDPMAATGASPAGGPSTGEVRDLVGRTIGRHRVVRELGRGGMGAVYEAVHESIGGRAAVKVMFSQLGQEPEFLERFFYEARIAGMVQHEGLVKVFDLGELEDGTLFILMEFLEGQSLQDALDDVRGRGEQMSQERAVQVGWQVASALDAVHDQGVVHRDLKPGNIMLISDPLLPLGTRAKLVDFGIAKVQDREALGAGGVGPITTAGRILGTPLYMSPEQCQQRATVNGAADVYALGVILYELLSGCPPFEADNVTALIGMHILQDPVPLAQRAPGAPEALCALVDRMLAKEPAQRPSAAAVTEALAALDRAAPGRGAAPPSRPAAEAPPPSPRRAARWLAVGGALAILAGGAAGWVARPAAPPGMVLIEGGSFQMGSPPEEAERALADCERELGPGSCQATRHQREVPVRQVRLSPFYLDTHEVTNEEYARWLDALARHRALAFHDDWIWDGPQRLINIYPVEEPPFGIRREGERFLVRPGLERRPVSQLSWEGARRYCEAHGKRLPTEAQWEFAARGPQGAPYPWGSHPPRCDSVVFARVPEQSCRAFGVGPLDVGQARWDRTRAGVHDLGGNASEWVQDRFQDPYPDCPAHACVDPVASDAGAGPLLRVARGGDWNTPASACRGAARSRFDPNRPLQNIGFRCAVPARRSLLEWSRSLLGGARR